MPHKLNPRVNNPLVQKIKSIILDDTTYIAFLLIVVAVGSYGLGRLSVTIGDTAVSFAPTVNLASTSPARVLGQTMVATATPEPIVPEAVSGPVNPTYVASKSGTKYHALKCPGAKQIKEENKIFFMDEQEAQASGYTRAANCPPR